MKLFFLSPQSHQRGFTMGEVVLASFLLSVGMTATISLIGSSFQVSVETQRLILASELAQEGIELARNVRDNALVDKAALGAPTDVFTNFPNGSRNCTIDYASPTFDCPVSPGMTLGLSGGFYRHGVAGGLFYRLLKISHTGGSDTATVKSFVTWQNPGSNLNGGGATTWCTLANKCVYTEILLTQWQ